MADESGMAALLEQRYEYFKWDPNDGRPVLAQWYVAGEAKGLSTEERQLRAAEGFMMVANGEIWRATGMEFMQTGYPPAIGFGGIIMLGGQLQRAVGVVNLLEAASGKDTKITPNWLDDLIDIMGDIDVK